MNPTSLLTDLAHRLQTAGHPDITVATADGAAVHVQLGDGTHGYVKLAHVGPATTTPARPTWPGYEGWRR